MQVKKNKVEMENKRKRYSWDVAETKYFLNLVKERKMLKNLDGKRFRVADVFEHLVVPMRKKGYVKSSTQMQMRFKTLKAQYNQYKRSSGKSGGDNCRSKFVYYDKMSELLGDRPITMQKGMHFGSRSVNSILEDAIDEKMHEDSQDERDGAIPGTSREPETCDVYKKESQDVSCISEENDIPNETDTDSYETESSGQRIQACNVKRASRSKRGGRSFQNFVHDYGNIANESAKELQNEMIRVQQTFLNNLLLQQQQFVKQMLKQMLDGHQQIMSDMTNQLLNGLRHISQPPSSPIQVSSPARSTNDSVYGSSSMSPPLNPARISSPPPPQPAQFCVASTASASKPVHLILRPSDTSSLPAKVSQNLASPLPSIRLVKCGTPPPVLVNPESNAPIVNSSSSFSSNVTQSNGQSLCPS